MPKWERWIDEESDDDLELVEDYQHFEPIKRRKKSSDDDDSSGKNKKKKASPEK